MTDFSLANPKFQFHRLFRFLSDQSTLGTCYNAELPFSVNILRCLKLGARRRLLVCRQFLPNLKGFDRHGGLTTSIVVRPLVLREFIFSSLKSSWDSFSGVYPKKSDQPSEKGVALVFGILYKLNYRPVNTSIFVSRESNLVKIVYNNILFYSGLSPPFVCYLY